jgi:hypothetical protein
MVHRSLEFSATLALPSTRRRFSYCPKFVFADVTVMTGTMTSSALHEKTALSPLDIAELRYAKRRRKPMVTYVGAAHNPTNVVGASQLDGP